MSSKKQAANHTGKKRKDRGRSNGVPFTVGGRNKTPSRE
jgi:hypothetical protein